MLFLLREVVVAIDPLQLQLALVTLLPEHGRAHDRQHAVHHLVAVVEGELLRPMQITDVLVERGMVLRNVGEVAIRERYTEATADVLRQADVVVACSVADSARAGVQRDPDCAVSIFSEFDEMIAAAKRAQREGQSGSNRSGLPPSLLACRSRIATRGASPPHA